jgi:hypothetical protein
MIRLDNIVEIRDHAAATSLAQCTIPLQFVNNIGVREIATAFLGNAKNKEQAATAQSLPFRKGVPFRKMCL